MGSVGREIEMGIRLHVWTLIGVSKSTWKCRDWAQGPLPMWPLLSHVRPLSWNGGRTGWAGPLWKLGLEGSSQQEVRLVVSIRETKVEAPRLLTGVWE